MLGRRSAMDQTSSVGDVVVVTNQSPAGVGQQDGHQSKVAPDGHALAKHDDVGSVGNSVMLGTVSNADLAKQRQTHQTADELQKADEDAKKVTDDGPMSPFFM